MDQKIIQEIIDISLSMFRKNFIGIFHGSISAKVDYNRFIINKRSAVFDELTKNDLIELYTKKDYRWNEASLDSNIHLSIYKTLSEAKYICHTMPPYTTAFSLKKSVLEFKDYFGYTKFGKIEIYDPKEYDNWYERADVEISSYFRSSNQSAIIIKGYGIYAYDRDIYEMAKKIAVIENSCRLLLL